MNLKAKILEFITKHDSGVTIMDMEQPLGEKRMRLGYVTQSLLEEGKIQKIRDNYYPVNEDQDSNGFVKSIVTNEK